MQERKTLTDRDMCAANAAPVAGLPETKPVDAVAKAGWDLLVVDADCGAADLAAGVLGKEEGYAVRTAYSGAEALALMRQEPADLILTDMVMPGMDGMQLLANVKELYPDTDVVVMTSFGTIEDAVEALRRGASDFLPKPYRPRDLKQVTATVLRARYAEQAHAFHTQSTAMLELAYLLARTTDVHTLPKQAVELVQRNFVADAVVILTRGTGDELSVLAHSGAVLAEWGRTERLTEQSLVAMAQTKLMLSADSATGDCYAYAPLLVAGQVSGVLCIRRDGGPWFHGKSTELIEVFTAHLALSLESARLYGSASQQVAELEELTQVSCALAADTDGERICAQLLEGAQRLTGAEICAALVEADGLTRTFTLPQLPAASAMLEAITAKLQTVRTGTGAAGAQPAHVRRMISSFLSAPMKTHGRDCGVVGVFSSREAAFAMDDVRRLTALAAHAAAGLMQARSMARISAMHRETAEMIATLVDASNRYTLGHSRSVRRYAEALARALGLGAEEIRTVADGALLHDIGKLCIPGELLDKPQALSAEEFAIVASHPTHGANMFKDAPHLQAAVPIVRHHHEHYDGSGYPTGLRAEEIPVGARIVAVADVFDALVTARTYRPALTLDVARSMIAERAGSQFDPEFARVFLSLPLAELLEET